MKQTPFEGRWTQVKHRVSGVLSANPWTRRQQESGPQREALYASPPLVVPPKDTGAIGKEPGIIALSAWEDEGGTTAARGKPKKLL
jgi:hypothetical protein